MSIRIEVCQRLGDEKQRSVVSPETGEVTTQWYLRYHAQVADQPGLWAAGETSDEAIGGLMRCNPEQFGIEIVHLKGAQAR